MKTTPPLKRLFAKSLLLPALLAAIQAPAVELFLFPFNEGGGYTITNTANTLSGYLGTVVIDPAADTVSLGSDSPSGAPGDGSFSNLGNGFLMANDTNQVLNITNGPITTEAWIKINPNFSKASEGILSYGNSYKMGLKGGVLVFTLMGKVDITNSAGGYLPADIWTHVAAAWTPGVGVDFYINGAHNFVANTNTTARPTSHTFLSLGSEGLNNTLIASFDRMRIHHAVLDGSQLDVEALNPKPAYASTLVSYNFNESAFPVMNSLAPALPADSALPIIPQLTGPLWTNGVSGGAGDTALYFDGTKRASVPDPSHLIVGNGVNADYTLETWVKLPVGFNPAARMIMFQYEGNPGFAFSINTGRTLHTTAFGLSGGDINSATSVVPNDGNWHHVAVVHKAGSQMRFYIDGVQTGTTSWTLGAGSRTTYAITLGASSAGANLFTGTLDRMRFSNQALSPDQFDYPLVPGAPFITANPTNLTVLVTSNATFTVTALGNAILTYQWRFSPSGGTLDRINLPGMTSSTLPLNNVQLSQDGYYSVLVTNSLGTAESSAARLTVSTAPLVTANPVDQILVVGQTATFTVAGGAAPGYGALSYQWRYGVPGNPEPKVNLPGATAPTLTLNNVKLTDQGFYSCVLSNRGGVTESTSARLTLTSPGLLRPLWRILPGERTYITPWNSSATYRDLERGMAYNPVTDHLLIGARNDSTGPIKGIYILDSDTGAEVGQLNNPGIVAGGTIVLTRVVAAEDGAIYACNFGTLSDSNPLKIYRWASESAQPEIAYQGNPVSGTGIPNQQWGKNMTVRGSGASTQLILDNRSFIAVFTTANGTTFTPSLVLPSATDDWGLGLWFGTGGTFWGKSSGKPLYQWQLNLPSTNAPLLRTYAGFPSSAFGNFSFSEDYKYLAGLVVQTGADAVELYDISDLNRGPMLVDIGLFPADNSQTVGYGNVYVARNRVFALNPNNGVVAFSIVPTLGIRQQSATVSLFWPASYANYLLEASTTLAPGSWTTVPHSTVGNENLATESASGPAKFYRLRTNN